MTDFNPPTAAPTQPRSMVLHREGTQMLLHEALARSRQREAEEAARHYTLARRFTAGRRWASLAGFADRRATRARASAGAAQLHGHSRSAVNGLRAV
ncbi:hypothetical protein GCM10009610_29100 [Pseudonocardia xinjiangensis]|jgi:hypothetical protein